MNHGGKRKGAGRKKIKPDESAHTKREEVNGHVAFHIGLKLVKGAPNLRSPKFLDAFLKAIERAKMRRLNVNQYEIESNHIHLIGETPSNETLKRGMQSLIASITWALRKLFQHAGDGFAKRYHLHAIRQPREMRKSAAMAPYTSQIAGVSKIVASIRRLEARRLQPITGDASRPSV